MSKEYSKSFYKSRAWIKCRDGYMKSKYYICERCGKAATIVHHKRFIDPRNINNPGITLNWDNLEAVCIICHNKVHGNSNVCVDGVSFDDKGDLIYNPISKK